MAAAVRHYAAEVLGRDSTEAEVSRFSAGERHAVYRVSFSEPAGVIRVVVRILHSAHDHDVVMAEREAAVLHMVGGRGAPHLYDFRRQSGWFDTPAMCLEYVAGESTVLTHLPPHALTLLGLLVGRVHTLWVGDLAPWLSLPTDLFGYAEQRADSILANMDRVDESVPDALRTRLEGAAQVVRALRARVRHLECFPSLGSVALLHGDLGPGNVLWSKEPVLIDWEYTRVGDPADELAYLFDQNELDSEQRQAVWAGYRQVDTDRPWEALEERVRWWEPVQLLGSALWWTERFVARAAAEATGNIDPSVPKDEAHYQSHIAARLDRFDALVL